jgi:hypothetical protein
MSCAAGVEMDANWRAVPATPRAMLSVRTPPSAWRSPRWKIHTGRWRRIGAARWRSRVDEPQASQPAAHRRRILATLPGLITLATLATTASAHAPPTMAAPIEKYARPYQTLRKFCAPVFLRG